MTIGAFTAFTTWFTSLNTLNNYYNTHSSWVASLRVYASMYAARVNFLCSNYDIFGYKLWNKYTYTCSFCAFEGNSTPFTDPYILQKLMFHFFCSNYSTLKNYVHNLKIPNDKIFQSSNITISKKNYCLSSNIILNDGKLIKSHLEFEKIIHSRKLELKTLTFSWNFYNEKKIR